MREDLYVLQNQLKRFTETPSWTSLGYRLHVKEQRNVVQGVRFRDISKRTAVTVEDDNVGGFNRSTQHLLAVYLQESGNPMSF